MIIAISTLEALNKKRLHEHLRGGWRSIGHHPVYFRHNHSIDMVFGIYNELTLYFQFNSIQFYFDFVNVYMIEINHWLENSTKIIEAGQWLQLIYVFLLE